MKTSTSLLRGHIEGLHLMEFVAATQAENWTIYIQSVKTSLNLGYDLSTLPYESTENARYYDP